jgi:PST family polysaccharide transporter
MEAVAAPTRIAELDRSFLRSLAWSGGAKWGSQIVSWISTIIVARILVPEDYGLVSMAMVFVGFVALLSEFGVGTAVIALPDLRDDQIAQLNSLAVLTGASLPAPLRFHSAASSRIPPCRTCSSR